MLNSRLHAQLLVLVLFALGHILTVGEAKARDAAGFAQALQEALSDKRVCAGAPTGSAPLLTANNEVISFQSGTRQAMDHLCEQIRTAQEEILLQVYEWQDDDEAGRMVTEALRSKIAATQGQPRLQPLVIRVVVNQSWPTPHATSHARLRELFAASMQSDPTGQHVLVELSERRGFAFGVVHAKYAVIDRQTLVLRTNNFITLDGVDRDFYNFSAELRGPVATTARAEWLSLRAESTPAEDASHAPAVWPFAQAHDGGSGGTSGGCAAVGSVDPVAAGVMAVLAKHSRINFMAEAPSNPQNSGLLAVIDAAEHEILSLNPALNVPAIKRAIETAIVHRGVDVTLVLSLNMNRLVQHRLQGGDNIDTLFEMYGHLLARGGLDAVRRLHVRWASDGTGQPAAADALGNNHAKTALYDGEALWMGSMNWDWQSWNNSRELSVLVFDRAVAPRWLTSIWQPVWERAAPLTVDDFHQCQVVQSGCRLLCGVLRDFVSP